MRRRRGSQLTSIAVLVGAATLLLTGCAKDDPVSVPPSPTAGSTVAPAASGSSSSTASVPEVVASFCAKFKEFGERANSLTDDNSDIATAKSYFQELADDAPPDLRADMVTFNQWVQNLTTVEQPPADLMAVGQRIGEWAQRNCAL